MNIPHRCSDNSCQAGVSLPKRWQDYKKPPTCKTCGYYRLRVDTYRLRVERKKNKCNCDGYHFPHRKGSKWCEHGEGGDISEHPHMG